MNLEILRKNKIVAIVVMFLLLGLIVWALDSLYGYSLFESFQNEKALNVALICNQYGTESKECKDAAANQTNE